MVSTLLFLVPAITLVSAAKSFPREHAASTPAKRTFDFKGAMQFGSPFQVGGNMSISIESGDGSFIKPEPINLIISSLSSFGGLQGTDDKDIFQQKLGFVQYLSALDISDECLGFHFSHETSARINGPAPESADFVYRENLGDRTYGTCDSTLRGGLKVRGWRQQATGAFFLAPTITGGLDNNHAPVANAYDAARDAFTARAVKGGIDALGCVWPPAKLEKVDNLVDACEEYHGDIAIDGFVHVLTVGKPICRFPIGGDCHRNGKGNNRTRTNGTNSTWVCGGNGGHGGNPPLVPINQPTPNPPSSPNDPPPSGGSPPLSPGPKPKVPPKVGNAASSNSRVVVGSLCAGLLLALVAL